MLTSLSSQITDLKQENSLLREDISSLRARVTQIENDATTSAPNTQSDLLAQLITETSDRDRCTKNILICGLPVCNSSNLADKTSADRSVISELFSTINVSLPVFSKLLRVGKTVSGTCPTKLIFNSSEEASQVLHDVQRSKKSGLLPQHISIVRDKRKRERDLLRAAYADLEHRQSAGETDLTVSYVNGIPKVIKRPSKN